MSTPFSVGMFEDMYVTVPEMQVVILPRHATVSILQWGFMGQKNIKKRYPYNRPWMPIELCGVEDPIFSNNNTTQNFTNIINQYRFFMFTYMDFTTCFI
jgi:hypothetical protein